MSTQTTDSELFSSICLDAARYFKRVASVDRDEAQTLVERRSKRETLLTAVKSEAERKAIEGELLRINAAIENLKNQWLSLARKMALAKQYAGAVKGLGVPPENIARTLPGLRNQMNLISQGADLAPDSMVTTLMDQLTATLSAWQQASAERALANLNRSKYEAEAKKSSESTRTYLLGNSREMAEAVRMGALKDRKGRAFITRSMNAERFKPYLPQLRNVERQKIDFSPLPKKVANLNIHQLFKSSEWAKVSGSVMAASGGCAICGKRGGSLISVLYNDKNYSPNTLHAHEHWAREVLPGKQRVGVTRLTGISSLCVDHHTCFHVDQAEREARIKGVDPEQVHAFLVTHARGINLQSLDEYREDFDLALEENRIFDQLVDTCIVDLSHLSERLGFSDHIFEFDAEKAPINADLVAGVQIRTPDGSVHAAQSVDEIISRLERTPVRYAR